MCHSSRNRVTEGPPALDGDDPVSSSDEYLNYIPTDPISKAAYDLAKKNLPRTILNHSLRVYLYAREVDKSDQAFGSDRQLPILFTACVLHDIGCAKVYDGPQRFEVEGADAAKAFLEQHHVSPPDCHEVWVAIACHSSPGIAERITPLARLVRLGVRIDFHTYDDLNTLLTMRPQIEADIPRRDIEKVLGDTVVDQALRQPQKAPSVSWPGHLLKSKLDNPDWDGINKDF